MSHNEGGDNEDGGETEHELLTRKRAVIAAVKLLAANEVTDPSLLDLIAQKEEAYFKFKIKRNIRRDKLQTVLKLFGFRSVTADDHVEPPSQVWDEIPETEEQQIETKIIKWYEKYYVLVLVATLIAQMYYLLVIPFRVCYDVPRGLLSLIFEGLFCDLVMYSTIVQRTYGPKDNNGVLRWRGRNENYFLSFWFFYDIVGNLPFDYLGLALGSKCTLGFDRCDLLAPYWQINRILNARLLIDNLLEVIELILARLLIHPFFALVIVVFFVQTYFWHLFACFLFLDVLRLRDSFEIITNGDTHMLNSSLPHQYASALDWSSKVLAGWDRGEASPSDSWSFVFNAAAVIVGICVMTTFVAFVSGAVEMITPYIAQTMDIDNIMDIINYKHGPVDLRDEMIIDRWYRWDSKTHMLRASEVCGELPDQLRDRLLHYEGSRLLSRVDLFAPLLKNERFVIEIARMLRPTILAPSEVLFEKGDEGDAMYFILDGRLGVLLSNEPGTEVKFQLTAGKYVGEIALLLGGVRTAKVIALDQYVRLLQLSKRDFESLRRLFPRTFAKVHVKARDRWMESNQALLDQAKEIGRKEIAAIARARFEQARANMKLAGVVARGGGSFSVGRPRLGSKTGSNLADAIRAAEAKHNVEAAVDRFNRESSELGVPPAAGRRRSNSSQRPGEEEQFETVLPVMEIPGGFGSPNSSSTGSSSSSAARDRLTSSQLAARVLANRRRQGSPGLMGSSSSFSNYSPQSTTSATNFASSHSFGNPNSSNFSAGGYRTQSPARKTNTISVADLAVNIWGPRRRGERTQSNLAVAVSEAKKSGISLKELQKSQNRNLRQEEEEGDGDSASSSPSSSHGNSNNNNFNSSSRSNNNLQKSDLSATSLSPTNMSDSSGAGGGGAGGDRSQFLSSFLSDAMHAEAVSAGQTELFYTQQQQKEYEQRREQRASEQREREIRKHSSSTGRSALFLEVEGGSSSSSSPSSDVKKDASSSSSSVERDRSQQVIRHHERRSISRERSSRFTRSNMAPIVEFSSGANPEDVHSDSISRHFAGLMTNSSSSPTGTTSSTAAAAASSPSPVPPPPSSSSASPSPKPTVGVFPSPAQREGTEPPVPIKKEAQEEERE